MNINIGTRMQALMIFTLGMSLLSVAQTTDIAVLKDAERNRLADVIANNPHARALYDSIAALALASLHDKPMPVKNINYEGLLENDPARVSTQQSLVDMDKITSLIYAFYGNGDIRYARKAKEISLAWCTTYQPDGNPINENKLTAIFWAYHIFNNEFSVPEKGDMERWMRTIAQKEMDRTGTPVNNWEAKRQKITATIGCILDDATMRTTAVEGFKKYIHNAYYPDGTSNDLKKRDALHYHLSGLKPCIAAFINCKSFDPRFDLYDYESPNGSSVKKSVAYAVPYAAGKETRKEWVNSQVTLDKERAAAGLPEYQPGKLFNPNDAIPTFEWACYYNPDWYALLGSGSAKENQTATWVGLLNSPLVRKK